MKRKNLVCFNKAYEFLKTTKFYQTNSFYIDKELTIFSDTEFTVKLKQVDLLNTDGRKIKMAEAVKDLKSRIILLDFWATWCSPCIMESKKMQKMNIPSDVSILNLSVDKLISFNNWTAKTNSLKHEYTYLLDETESNFDFLKMIQLNEIPRYIIVDENLNLLNYEFDKPTDKDFIPNLIKEIRE